MAAITAYALWLIISKFINEKFDTVTDPKKIKFWRNLQWVTSAWLWAAWLMHDVANIALFAEKFRLYTVADYSDIFYSITILHFLCSWRSNTKGCFR